MIDCLPEKSVNGLYGGSCIICFTRWTNGLSTPILDLILGQFRHIMFHIGMIHGCILMKNGEIPDYVGLAKPIRPIKE